jgi:recombination protein RecA
MRAIYSTWPPAVRSSKKSGAWLNYGSMRLGQGRENAKKFLTENKDLCEELKNKIFVAKGLC